MEAASIFEQQLQAFRQKFGREAGPGDPVFFDPDASEPKFFSAREVKEAVVRAMHQAGIREEIIYAYKKTSRIVTASNRSLLTSRELKEWVDAIKQFRQAMLHRPVKRPRRPGGRRQ